MITKFLKILEEISENKAAVAILGVLAGFLLTKFLPAVWANLRNLLAWIGRLVGGRLAFKSFERKYLDWVVTEHQELKLTGVVSADDAKKPKLEQVFVSLALNKRNMSSPENSEDAYIPLQSLTLDELDRLLGDKEKRTDEEQRHARNAIAVAGGDLRAIKEARRIGRRWWMFKNPAENNPLKEAARAWVNKWSALLRDVIEDSQVRYILNEHKRVAILGAPGAGKTTLLQFIALIYAREKAGDPRLCDRGSSRKNQGLAEWRLPLFLRLSSVASLLADAARENRDASIIDILPSLMPPDLQKENVVVPYLLDRISSGQAVFLLDGLDEVPTDQEFKSVVRAVESLVIRYPENYFIITSRMAGWRGGIRGEFETFQVNDLNDKQIDRFVDTWYSAVEQNAVIGRLEDEGAADRSARKRRASQRARELKETIRDNIGIRRLTTNPMLLSIIAVVHRSLATLPKERGKLYSQCSKILLEQWDISRGVRVDDTNLKLEQKEAIMRLLAISLHAGQIGEPGGGREASRKEVTEVMADLLPSLGRSREDAKHLLQRLIERSGVIVERRRDVLSFAHLTFQEYFAAQYLAAGEHMEHRDFLLKPEHLLSEWWQEVILLYSGLLSDSSEFILAVNYDKEEDLFSRRLRLAGLCLGEAIEVKKPEARQSIFLGLLKVRERDPKASTLLMNLSSASSYLIQWARGDSWFGNAAIANLGLIGGKFKAGSSLLDQVELGLRNEQGIIRRAVLDLLCQFPIQPLQITFAAVELMKDDDRNVRWGALRYLSKIAPDNLSFKVLRLLEAMSDKERREEIKLREIDIEERGYHAYYRHRLGDEDDFSNLQSIVPTKLLFAWLSGEDEFLRDIALRIGLKSDGEAVAKHMVDRVLHLILFDHDAGERILSKWPWGEAAFRKFIAERFLNDELFVYKNSVSLPHVIQGLLGAFRWFDFSDLELLIFNNLLEKDHDKNNDGFFRETLYVSILKILQAGRQQPLLADALLDHLINRKSISPRRSAIPKLISWMVRENMPIMPSGSSTTRIKQLAASNNCWLRSFALQCLGSINEEVDRFEALRLAISMCRDRRAIVRAAAFNAVGKLVKSGVPVDSFEFVVAALNDRDGGVRVAVAELCIDNWWIVTDLNLEEKLVDLAFSLVRAEDVARVGYFSLSGLLREVYFMTHPLRMYPFRLHSPSRCVRAVSGIEGKINSVDFLPNVFKYFDALSHSMADSLFEEFVLLCRQASAEDTLGRLLNPLSVSDRIYSLLIRAVPHVFEEQDVPALREVFENALNHKSVEVRISALASIGKMSNSLQIDSLRELVVLRLEDDNENVREEAWRVIKILGLVKSEISRSA